MSPYIRPTPPPPIAFSLFPYRRFRVTFMFELLYIRLASRANSFRMNACSNCTSYVSPNIKYVYD